MIHWELSISVADKVATTQNNFCWDGIIIGKKNTTTADAQKNWDPGILDLEEHFIKSLK